MDFTIRRGGIVINPVAKPGCKNWAAVVKRYKEGDLAAEGKGGLSRTWLPTTKGATDEVGFSTVKVGDVVEFASDKVRNYYRIYAIDVARRVAEGTQISFHDIPELESFGSDLSPTYFTDLSPSDKRRLEKQVAARRALKIREVGDAEGLPPAPAAAKELTPAEHLAALERLIPEIANSPDVEEILAAFHILTQKLERACAGPAPAPSPHAVWAL